MGIIAPRRIVRNRKPWTLQHRIDRWFLKYIRPDGDCWVWTGFRTEHGYGQVGFGGHTQLIHRVMYDYFRAQIPAGLEIDHLCHNPPCCNPWHLEPVTKRVNLGRRVYTKGAR